MHLIVCNDSKKAFFHLVSHLSDYLNNLNRHKLSQLIHNENLWCLKQLVTSQRIVKVTFPAVSITQRCHHLTIRMMESMHFAI